MDTYDIIRVGLHGFGVDVASAAGTQCVRGFPTRMAAQCWVEEQRQMRGEAMLWQDVGRAAAMGLVGARMS